MWRQKVESWETVVGETSTALSLHHSKFHFNTCQAFDFEGAAGGGGWKRGMGAIVIVGNMLAQPFVVQLAVGRSEDIKS